ncbi:hypothetical protein DXK93_27375 [Achromobacter sp. K91]|uniref:hypothetical protein n=1 Tax=Achromobacter sp. K91 TaxID=2292262 RepID=UPI000E666A29|nr:hypothetical protein [Achromobacter sp. K91]RIJ00284.1 hypothetical protein DXK93_27375 [Achromobacter sp. K91]
MPIYRALQRGQIPAIDVAAVKRADQPDGRQVMRMIEAGEIFEYGGKPGKWMELVTEGNDGQTGNARRRRSETGSTASGSTSKDGNDGQTGLAGSQAQASGASESGPASR